MDVQVLQQNEDETMAHFMSNRYRLLKEHRRQCIQTANDNFGTLQNAYNAGTLTKDLVWKTLYKSYVDWSVFTKRALSIRAQILADAENVAANLANANQAQLENSIAALKFIQICPYPSLSELERAGDLLQILES